jgi:hypothetical protein
LCLFTGVVAALAVPVLGMDGSSGIWISMLAALGAPTLLLAVRRLSLSPVPRIEPVPGEGESK